MQHFAAYECTEHYDYDALDATSTDAASTS